MTGQLLALAVDVRLAGPMGLGPIQGGAWQGEAPLVMQAQLTQQTCRSDGSPRSRCAGGVTCISTFSIATALASW